MLVEHRQGDVGVPSSPSLHDCASGSCGCPTNQYDRLESMDVKSGDGNITVRLRPLPGERLDTDEIRACLDYTLTQTQEE
jgi:hypothetical protein